MPAQLPHVETWEEKKRRERKRRQGRIAVPTGIPTGLAAAAARVREQRQQAGRLPKLPVPRMELESAPIKGRYGERRATRPPRRRTSR